MKDEKKETGKDGGREKRREGEEWGVRSLKECAVGGVKMEMMTERQKKVTKKRTD